MHLKKRLTTIFSCVGASAAVAATPIHALFPRLAIVVVFSSAILATYHLMLAEQNLVQRIQDVPEVRR